MNKEYVWNYQKNKKEFKPYNEYVDRPFELKRATAFPFGELQAAIKETNDSHYREIIRFPQQSQAQIEHLLDRSIKLNKVLEIQLNSLDEYERVKPSIHDVFLGMAEFDVAFIGEYQIYFYDIRHIKIHDFYKWSALERAENLFVDVGLPELTDEEQESIDSGICRREQSNDW
ncbi:hypothetical protein D929_01910 [Enterococcus faecalis 02-MB-P-10]|uniref:hypothetical protein n=1 Tax=Enterococcus faecalis TaxID=1351 RepID=UPI0003529747|nr:hypothetical protein [Enterococcus faecalis]EPH72638.1 hypothetical protein D929_01910 [Enterococcus faecalis 02-MB-P-10]